VGAAVNDIVVPVHNAPDCVRRLLEQLDRTALGHRRIIVDDASDRETALVISEYGDGRDDVIVLRNEKQQLFTRAVNKGLRASTTERIAVLNTDLAHMPGWLERMTQAMDSDKSIGLVGYPHWCSDDEDWDREVVAPAFITCHCILLRRAMLREIGVLCETDYSQAHIRSDKMLSYRANACGWRTLEIRAPLCIHGNGGSWNRNVNWLFKNFDYSQLEPGRDTL
jgi:GT2 family glycosyltransferase